MSLHLALVHFPTVDKHGQTVCTSVTNLDMHDLSRAGMTYGAERVWVVHPYEPQKRFLRRVLRHWLKGWGAAYNPSRRESLSQTELADDLLEVASRIEALEGRRPVFVGTSARPNAHSVSYKALRRRMEAETETPFCLVFGTGWGLHPEALESMELILDPIYGPTDWNHLSVRAAVGIILDRLRGQDHPLTT